MTAIPTTPPSPQQAVAERIRKALGSAPGAVMLSADTREEVLAFIATQAVSEPPAGVADSDWSDRYRVERGGLRYCVRAGTGTRGLFFGSKIDCERVARELLTAFYDGQFVATPTHQAAEPQAKADSWDDNCPRPGYCINPTKCERKKQCIEAPHQAVEPAASDDLVARLRNTPNWRRESYGHWKECVSEYDRTPFEAADEIERLRAAGQGTDEPYAWFWSDGSDSGVLTLRQDFESHQRDYPSMRFTPVWSTPRVRRGAQPQSAARGMVLVPREPTAAMMMAFNEGGRYDFKTFGDRYAAMIAAAAPSGKD